MILCAELMFFLLFSSYTSKTEKVTISFDDQMVVFESLGYKLNTGISKQYLYNQIKAQTQTNPDSFFEAKPFSYLYCQLGHAYDYKHYNTNQCILYDLEFIDQSEEYIHFMERMGLITSGEIAFSDIYLFTDNNNYEWIQFKANGIEKKWKLEQKGYVSDAFFQRFSYLPKELNTKGRYTFYEDGGQQFVIDYATEKEQANFKKQTGLSREWLGEGKHFSQPND